MSAKPSPSCTLLVGGDVAPMRKEGRGMFGGIAPLFQEADLAFANLEHALSRRGKLMKGKPTFHRGAPELVEGLVEAKFDVLGLANNHILDYGEESLFETLEVLDASGLPHTGAGEDLAAARRPVLLERGGLRVGLLAFSTTLPQGHAAAPQEPGVNPIRVKTAFKPLRNVDYYPGSAPEICTWTVPEDLKRMRQDIRRLKNAADALVVYQHWGASMVHEVHDFQREIGQAAVDAGADVVLGGHQHVLSAVEFYRGKPIVHCTGNLIFDKFEPFFTDATLQTFLFGGTLTRGGLREPYLIPCRCGVGAPPKRLSPSRGEGREIVRMLERLSAPSGTTIQTKGERVAVIPHGR